MDNSRKPPDDLNKEDQGVWDRYMDDGKTRKEEENFAELLDSHIEKPAQEKQRIDNPKKPDPVREIVRSPHKSSEIDRRTEEKIRKGKMPIDDKLDLHGMSQTKAHAALTSFIQRAIKNKYRCVLVVTGKGKATSTSEDWIKPGQGVLRQKVPEWLTTDIFKDYVLKFFPAQPQHGGSGALYVYLRRQR